MGRLSLNAGAARAGDSYQCAMSLTGHSPGLNLGIGTLHLRLDSLFVVTASNIAPTLFQNFSGTLDASGVAPQPPMVVLPAAARGLRVWVGAATYDNTGLTSVSNCFGVTVQ